MLGQLMGHRSQLFLAFFILILGFGQAWAAKPIHLEKYVREAMVHILWKKPNEGAVEGSGVVIRLPDFPDKYVLTAHHVIEDAIQQKIPISLQSFGMPEGQGQVTELEGWHMFHDLASYQLPESMEKIRPLKLSRKILKAGDKVGVYAFPLGMPWKSLGFIKGTASIFIDTPMGPRIVPKYVFTNFVLPGSSGGMMVNSKGQLMGLVTHGGKFNMGYATPSRLILELVDNAVKNGWRPGRNKDIHPFENPNGKNLDPFEQFIRENRHANEAMALPAGGSGFRKPAVKSKTKKGAAGND